MEDIRGLKALEAFHYSPLFFLLWIGIPCLLLFIGWWLWRRRRRVKAAPPPMPEIPLRERILARLKNLREEDPILRGEEKLFHFRLSEILRAYLEERYLFPASDSTTEEIRFRLSTVPQVGAGDRESILKILQATDTVKFAKGHLDHEEALHLLGDAESLVMKTSP